MVLEKMKHHFYFSFFVVLLLAQSMFFLGIKYSLGADSLVPSEAFVCTWTGSTILNSNNQINLQAETNREVQNLSFEIRKDDYSFETGLLGAQPRDNSKKIWSRLYDVPAAWSNGLYTIYIRTVPVGMSESTGAVVVTHQFVLNKTSNEAFTIRWLGSESVRSDNGIVLQAETSREAQSLSFEITKDDNTLSSGLLVAESITNINRIWAKNYYFPDTWPNGNYKINIQATPLGEIATTNSVDIIQPFILNRSVVNNQFVGGDLSFIYDSTMSGEQALELRTLNWSQQDFNDIAVQFKVYSGPNMVYHFAPIKGIFSSDNQKISGNFNTNLVVNGNYKICADVTVGVYQKYLKCGPQVEIYNIGNVQAREIKLYLEEGLTLRSGDKVYASSNFINPDRLSSNPSLSIKTTKNTGSVIGEPLPPPYIVAMSAITCTNNVIPVEIKTNIAQLGHGYCWQAQVPAENIPLSFSSGSGSVISQYGKFLSNVIRVSFVLSDSSVGENPVDNSNTTNVQEAEVDVRQENIANDATSQIVDLEQNKDIISFGAKVSCVDSAVYDEANCQEFLATLGGQINQQCLGAGIYNDLLCEDYLLKEQIKNECSEQNIIDSKACQDFLLEKYLSTVECRIDNKDLCLQTLREKYLNRFLVAKNQQTKISSTTESMIGQVWALDALSAKLTENKIDAGILPLLADKETKVLLARSSQHTILESTEQLTILQDVVMIVDNDADGLSNDMEKYYGTDANNPDSDADSYSDGEEVAKGFNPLGEGLLVKDRSNLDKIISSGSSLEQPTKLSQKIDENFKVTFSRNENNTVRLAGVAEANTWLNIFLYSDLPLVMTTKTDASGNWTYDVQNSLVDGGHQVYVTVNDDTGNVVKQSSPISFLVKSAQAVTVDQYFDTNTSAYAVSDGILWNYILTVLGLMIVGFIFIFILYRHKKSQKEKFNDQI